MVSFFACLIFIGLSMLTSQITAKRHRLSDSISSLASINKHHNSKNLKSEHKPSDYEYSFDRKYINIPTDNTNIAISLITPLSDDENEKFPVLLEYSPYRKDDSLPYINDWEMWDYFGKRGFIVCKADIRGTGSSTGATPPREYSDIEMSDGEYIIEWLATEYEKSNGNIAMYGISWSAINSLILSLIKAVIYIKTIFIFHASDDLYYNDINYIDGSMHFDSDYFMYRDHAMSLPSPLNAILDDTFFTDRFEQTPWLFEYVQQQVDSTWWRNKSVKFNINNNIPLYLWAGQMDGYRDYAVHLYESNSFQHVKIAIGPWDHTMSAKTTIFPREEWKHQAERWFNLWLRDGNNSILDEPDIAMYVRHYTPGQTGTIDIIPGEWRTYNSLAITEEMKLYLNTNFALSEELSGISTSLVLKYDAMSGIHNQNWWGENVDLGNIVNETNGIDGLIFQTDLLPNMYEIIGFVNISLMVTSWVTISKINWIIRLEDYNPATDECVLVSGANRNSANIINGRLDPTDTDANLWYDICFRLHWTSWQFPAGHRIRIVITNAAWPMLWPLAVEDELFTNIMVNNLSSYIVLPISNMYKDENDEWIVFNASSRSLGDPAFMNDEIEMFVGPDDSCMYVLGNNDKYDIKSDYDDYSNTRNVEISSNYHIFSYIDGRKAFNEYDWRMYLNDSDPNKNNFEGYARTVYILNEYIPPILIQPPLCVAVPPDVPNYPFNDSTKYSIDLWTYFKMTSDLDNFYVTINKTIFQNGTLQNQVMFNQTVPRHFQ